MVPLVFVSAWLWTKFGYFGPIWVFIRAIVFKKRAGPKPPSIWRKSDGQSWHRLVCLIDIPIPALIWCSWERSVCQIVRRFFRQQASKPRFSTEKSGIYSCEEIFSVNCLLSTGYKVVFKCSSQLLKFAKTFPKGKRWIICSYLTHCCCSIRGGNDTADSRIV